MRTFLRACAYVLGTLAACPVFCQAAAQQDVPSRPVVVLDTTGFWRLHHTLKPPVIQLAEGLKPVLLSKWLDRETPPPPADWRSVDFDDSTWLRGPARIVCRTPYLARLCMRGRFLVTDPARVGGLSLSVAYHGGIIVGLNGAELARRYLPPGHLAADALAEPYPEEAFVSEKGGLLVDWDLYKTKLSPERSRRLALRERSIQQIPIPPERLRRGVNVLTIEIIRAPYDKVLEAKKDAKPGRKGCVYNLSFNTCEIMRVQMTAADAAGVVPCASRPAGMQVWNSDVLASDFDMDFASPAEPLYPVRIVGVPNGIFSGKVVVGSDAAIERLRAQASDLKADGAIIPASAVRIRYGIPWGAEDGVWGGMYTYWDTNYSRYARQPTLLGVLAESPLDVFPVSEKQPSPRYDLNTPGQPDPVFGAVVPVWFTVNVPADAAPGTYAGRLTITAKGEMPVHVPVELEVVDWALPDPDRWRTWAELIQVPDTSAVEYGVPLWSDRHWRMVTRAMDLIGETCSRVLYVPLICHTNLGNEQSMVRWIEKGGGTYDYDFSVMERYLDTAEEHMGRPRLVVFQVWDTYLMQKDKLRPSSSHDQERRSLRHLQGLKAVLGTGPVVTVVDPATGETENVELTRYTEPISRTLWEPVYAGVLERMRERGLEGAAALGIMSDAWPTQEESRLFSELSGDLPWVSCSHMGVRGRRLHDVADVIYETTVTQNRFANTDPPTGSLYGWKGDYLFAEYARGSNYIECPASRMRHAGEFNITGKQRGPGRIGADFWSAVRDAYGRRRGTVAARYPQSSWRNLNLYSSLLGPGPDGPASTYRFEAFREGLQECEARIRIEEALTDEKLRVQLGADLVRRCEDALVERTHYMIKSLGQLKLTGPQHWYVTVNYTYWHRSPGPVGHQWFLGSGWQERSRRIYGLAAEVAKRLSRK
jgi:hypothetical protein